MRYAITTSLVVILIAIAIGAEEAADFSASNMTLGDLAWMEGSWHGRGLGGDIEEHWTAAAGGTMVGVFRLTADLKVRVIEYLMITQEPDRVVYRFKHFGPDYTAWEKDRPLEFTLVAASAKEAVFHSDVADQNSPRRLTYRLVDPDSLSVVVEGSGEGGALIDRFEVQLTRR